MTVLASLPEIRLHPRKALPFFSRHPWVFHSAIASQAEGIAPGSEVVLKAHDGKFIARGLFNPHSNIRVRLYSWDEQQALDDPFWSRRLDDAIALRRRLFGPFTPELACRLVYSEADQFSGLTVDRFGDWLTVQITSRALADRCETLFDLLQEKLSPKGILLKTEKGMRAAEGLELTEGLVRGVEPPRPLLIRENDINYAVDLASGQKTGFFIDQRDNRRRIASFANQSRVLDMFCYSGGFALNCLVHGPASEVIAVDSSAAALELMHANAERNGVADRLQVMQEDGFTALEQLVAAGDKFDTVILDPPKLAKHRDSLDAAMRGYFSLNRLGLDVLNPGGLLMTCSCSGLVSHDLFTEMLGRVALQANRHIQILEARGPGPDHPTSVHCLETDYLKCYLCRVT